MIFYMSTEYRKFKKRQEQLNSSSQTNDGYFKMISDVLSDEDTKTWVVSCPSKYLKLAIHNFLVDRNFRFIRSFEECPFVFIDLNEGYFKYIDENEIEPKYSIPSDWGLFVKELNAYLTDYPLDFSEKEAKLKGSPEDSNSPDSIAIQAEYTQKERENTINAIRSARKSFGGNVDKAIQKKLEIRYFYTIKATSFDARFMSKITPNFRIKNGVYKNTKELIEKNDLYDLIEMRLGNDVIGENYVNKNQYREDFILEVFEIMGFDFLFETNQVQVDSDKYVYIFPEKQHTTYFDKPLKDIENPVEKLNIDEDFGNQQTEPTITLPPSHTKHILYDSDKPKDIYLVGTCDKNMKSTIELNDDCSDIEIINNKIIVSMETDGFFNVLRDIDTLQKDFICIEGIDVYRLPNFTGKIEFAVYDKESNKYIDTSKYQLNYYIYQKLNKDYDDIEFRLFLPPNTQIDPFNNKNEL